MTINYDRLTDLFENARDLPPGEREGWLDGIDDPDLRSQLKILLESDADCDGFLEAPPIPPIGPAPTLPERIGPYEIIELIGRGGMGVVYKARQKRPRRDVALKVISPGLLGAGAMRRLLREADILASLSHPGVAKAFDAGSAPVGGVDQPYIAMELIQGDRITEHADREELSLRGRIELLVEVCDAVHHAHARGVIHRDLKPGNILVEICESGPRPRILDFGIAVAANIDATTTIKHGGPEGVVGTLAYMSPEQRRGLGDIDTRTDVYSLGVIGYELLTGTTPIDIGSGTIGDQLLRLEQREPAPLSAADASLRGDLETVFRVALSDDPDQRYASVSAFAGDLRAFLESRPISATPPSTVYLLRKWATRNRAMASAVGVGACAVLLGVALMAVGLVRASASAELADRRAEEFAREAEHARATAGFYHDVLFWVDPALAGVDASFIDVLASAEERAAYLVDHPRLEGHARFTLGVLYRRHARYEAAESNLRRAVLLREEVLGVDHPDTAESRHALAQVMLEYRGAAVEAGALIAQALDVLNKHPGNSELPFVWLDLARVQMANGACDKAEDSIDHGMKILRSRGGERSVFLNLPLIQLADLYLLQGRPAEAESVCRRGIELSPPGTGQRYPRARLEMRLARARLAQGDAEGSLRIINRVLPTLGLIVSESHEILADAHATRCRSLLDLGRAEEALEAAMLCDEIRERTLHSDHWRRAESALLLARAGAAGGELDSARVTLESLRRPLLRRLCADHPLLKELRDELASVYDRLGLNAHAQQMRAREPGQGG